MALTPLLGSAGPDRHTMHRHIHRQVPHMRTKSLKKRRKLHETSSHLSLPDCRGSVLGAPRRVPAGHTLAHRACWCVAGHIISISHLEFVCPHLLFQEAVD